MKNDTKRFDGFLMKKIFKLTIKIYIKIKKMVIVPNNPISEKI